MIEYTVEVHGNGDRYWYLNGRYHREDGPAVESCNGTRCWYRHGLPHREDGPAVERHDGNKYWFINGELHREDGPAIEYADGTKEWYLNGKLLTEDEFNKRMGKHVIQIDGKEIILSSESYESLKKALK